MHFFSLLALVELQLSPASRPAGGGLVGRCGGGDPLSLSKASFRPLARPSAVSLSPFIRPVQRGSEDCHFMLKITEEGGGEAPAWGGGGGGRRWGRLAGAEPGVGFWESGQYGSPQQHPPPPPPGSPSCGGPWPLGQELEKSSAHCPLPAPPRPPPPWTQRSKLLFSRC